jgi:hypothetical protein
VRKASLRTVRISLEANRIDELPDRNLPGRIADRHDQELETT